MTKYKLLNQDRTTYGGIKWPIGQWNEATGDSNQSLCTNGWLHCYDDPYLALFLNPIHADIKNPIICEVEVAGDSKNDRGLKRGYRKMRVLKDLSIPEPTTEQRIKFAIYCTLEVYDDPNFKQWASNWLSGTDRSIRATWAAAEAVWAAWATWAAAEAAARATAWAAARAAAWAAETAARAAKTIDLVSIAKKAMGETDG